MVVTVHDTTPFNGSPTHPLQARGFLAALGAADRLIVHTAAGRRRLAALGIAPERIAVVPHGPLGRAAPRRDRPRGARLTLVAFGKMRPYKGLDVLVEALARLDADTRAGLRVIVAGEPMMDLAPLRGRIAGAGLGEVVALVPRRLDEAETGALFEAADGFVFPYREIEASGVFYLVQGLGRWLIASRLGAFAEAIEDGASGRLVRPGDPDDLAAALREAANSRPFPPPRRASPAGTRSPAPRSRSTPRPGRSGRRDAGRSALRPWPRDDGGRPGRVSPDRPAPAGAAVLAALAAPGDGDPRAGGRSSGSPPGICRRPIRRRRRSCSSATGSSSARSPTC